MFATCFSSRFCRRAVGAAGARRSASSASPPSAPPRSGRSRRASTPRSTRRTSRRGCSGSRPARTTSARRGARQNAEFIAGLFRSWGYDARSRSSRSSSPRRRSARLEMVAPTRFTATLAEPPLPEDSTSGQTAEQLPTYNAYSDRRRRHRRAGLRQLRRARRLRGAGAPRHRREGQDRHRPLRRLLARHQAQGGRRARRHRLHHLLRPARGRLRARATPTRRAAGGPTQGAQRGSVADMPLYPGDPLTPGVGATTDAKRLDRSEAPTLTKIPVLPISARDALPLLRALGGPMAPGGLARRAAHPLPPRPGPGPGPPASSRSTGSWCPPTTSSRRCAGAERPDQWVIRGNHHDAWVNGADRPGERHGGAAGGGARGRRARARAAGGRGAPSSTPPGTARSRACSARRSGSRRTPTSCASKAVRLHQLRQQPPRLPRASAARTPWRRSSTRCARDVLDPQKGVSGGRARSRARRGPSAARDEQKRGARRQAARASSRWARAPTTRRSSSTWASPRSTSASAARTSTASTTRSTTRSTTTRGSWTPTSTTASPSRRRRPPRAAPRRGRRPPLRFGAASPRPSARYVDEVVKLADDDARGDRDRATGAIEQKAVRASSPTRTRPWWRRSGQEPVPHLNFAPLQQRGGGAAPRARRAYEAREDARAGERPRSSARRRGEARRASCSRPSAP